MRRRALKKGQTPNQFQTQLYDRITRVETQVLDRIQKLKSTSKSFICEHFNQPSAQCQPFNENLNFYDKFWKRFMLNEIGKQNIRQYKQHIEHFTRKLDKIQSLFEEHEKLDPRTKRRKSSRVSQSERYECQICSKKYGDEELLIIHMRVKHREGMEERGVRMDPQKIFQENNEDSQ